MGLLFSFCFLLVLLDCDPLGLFVVVWFWCFVGVLIGYFGCGLVLLVGL